MYALMAGRICCAVCERSMLLPKAAKESEAMTVFRMKPESIVYLYWECRSRKTRILNALFIRTAFIAATHAGSLSSAIM
jgi:hypothetical protein